MPSAPVIEPTRSDVYTFISPKETLKNAAAQKSVLITGGGVGLGKAIATTFAIASARAVILFGRRVEPLEQTRAEISELAPDCDVSVFSVDVTNADSVQQAFAKLKEQHKSIDVVVNNAGRCSEASIADSDVDVWWGDFELNVKAKYLVSREYLRFLQNKPGRIINVTSSVSTQYLPGYSAYCASKSALNRLTEFLDAEGAPSGVRCMSFHPGAVRGTEMVGYIPDWLKDVINQRGMVSPELPAATCLYLSTPRSDFLAGRAVWANWDMEQLQGMKETIEKDGLFTQRILFG